MHTRERERGREGGRERGREGEGEGGREREGERERGRGRQRHSLLEELEFGKRILLFVFL